jgi:hypothetical protein
MDRGARYSSCSECYVGRLGFVGFHSPFFRSDEHTVRCDISRYEKSDRLVLYDLDSQNVTVLFLHTASSTLGNVG